MCIDITESNGEVQKGYYNKKNQKEIGEKAYNHDGHRNRRFLELTRVGPYPTACKHAWDHLRMDTAYVTAIVTPYATLVRTE